MNGVAPAAPTQLELQRVADRDAHERHQPQSEGHKEDQGENRSEEESLQAEVKERAEVVAAEPESHQLDERA